MFIEENFCSTCGAELTDLKCEIEIGFNVTRKTSNDTWENVPNAMVSPREVLCEDCFKKFVNALEASFKKEEESV